MVRNVPSMQSLHANTTHQTDIVDPPLIRLPSRSRMQVVGTDEYTKQLMHRVATEVATDEELAAFHAHISKLQTERKQQISASLSSDSEASNPSSANHTFSSNAADYAKPFCDFITNNPTVFHTIDAVKSQLSSQGWKELGERDIWNVKPSGKYFVIRNGTAMIAFAVGAKYEPGNGAAIIAGHVDSLTAKLRPVSQVPNKAGYAQLGVGAYAGGPNTTWWDRDLGVGGRVIVEEDGVVKSKLVKLDWPIARIPTLAPHFGAASAGPFNPETQMTPIIGTISSDSSAVTFLEDGFSRPPVLSSQSDAHSFTSTQPPQLVRAISKQLGLQSTSKILNWELELFDVQPAAVGGIEKDFIFAGRIDDKVCSWAAVQALIHSVEQTTESSGQLKIVGLFDDEEIGSLLRQGARGNFMSSVIERAVGALSDHKPASDIYGRTCANSYLLSADVTHAVNPNFLNAYLENHAPHLNTGVAIAADPNGHMTSDSVSIAILKKCADKVGAKLQLFQIRNDSRSGGTVGPMLSSSTGIRAIDVGIPQLSMHSIRATIGILDPGLGVITFKAFLDEYEAVDKNFRF